jgi:hypothetical protein
MKKFKNPLDPDDINIKSAIKKWTIDLLKLEADSEIEITENLCSEASCVYAETLVKVVYTDLSRGNREGSRFFKITKPLTFIRKLDVQNMSEIKEVNSTHKH